jgi:glycosidase
MRHRRFLDSGFASSARRRPREAATELFECPGFNAGHFNNDHALRMIKDLWYKNAIFIVCRSALTWNSNADGIGDFQGLMRRLDYLSGLGITAI